MDIAMKIGIALTLVGFGFLALSGITFRLRAVMNKPAWNGPTVPFLIIGLLFFLPGLGLVMFFYNK